MEEIADWLACRPVSELRPGWSSSAISSVGGEAQERSIVGETPNLAARLQEIAEPNMVVICDSTRRLLGNLFELEDLGPRDLKGLARPARAWAALRASSVVSRFEALRATGLKEERCCRRPRPRLRTWRSLPRCCRCRTMDAIPRSN
jgi:hypothetical protein